MTRWEGLIHEIVGVHLWYCDVLNTRCVGEGCHKSEDQKISG